VAEDVAQGRISPERARSVYGVAVHPRTLALDEAATQRLRAGSGDD
jgi:N-methylhydantoinase B/oxoprolinase/acetone carboxylase alpha subunit